MTPAHADLETHIVSRLRVAGCVFAEDEARLLLSESSTLAELDDMVDRRVAGLPLEQVLGWAAFCGLRIIVETSVFVPRRRTEFLAAQAVLLAQRIERPVVLDLCCGAGAIAAVIAARVRPVELVATDIEPAAVRCARLNIAGSGRVFEGDLFDPLPRELRCLIDVIVANAPYVPTAHVATLPPEARLHEPRVTLDGGIDGLELHRRIADAAPHWLKPGGHLLMECSDSQAERLVRIFTNCGLVAHNVRDGETQSTVVVGTNPRPGERCLSTGF